MREDLKEYQPAYHRELIRQGLMTEKESERLIQDFLDEQEFKAQINAENTRENIMSWLEMHGFPTEAGWEI